MPTYYRNESLFSEIYLQEVSEQNQSRDALAALQVLADYRTFADPSSLLAWQRSYVHQVLSALGFAVVPRTSALTELFRMGETVHDGPLSLCCALLPEENLDNTTMGRNWAEKIIRALRESHLRWGLLTNGKQWRIYHLDEPKPYETYLEMDLEGILKDRAQDAFQIFYKFMRAENFEIREEGKCRFDLFKQESQQKIDYIETELTQALKQREEGGKGVLSDLCMGYVTTLRHEGKEANLTDEKQRALIYESAMLYMFRLLFLFYADARDLLNDANHVSLQEVERTCRMRYKNPSAGNLSRTIWQTLEGIFADIDETYNGGLFSPQESNYSRFLADNPISDVYLVNAIFNMTTYREKNGVERPVSYRDMSVRHLGTLYEGLLEHKLYIAGEDTEVRPAKGKVQFIPVSQGGKLIKGLYVKAGQVYFAGNKTERKASGSYYTPEYIVDYIVRKTLGEKLDNVRRALLEGQRPIVEAHQAETDSRQRSALETLLEKNTLDFVDEKILTLSILDPAMGSGHFLVNASNVISNFITEILNETGMQTSFETGTAYWRRRVVENCIYGVDLNPLAVELAKLSLWIQSMVKDQPLSFLNHHLKRGNSLVGARLDELGSYPTGRRQAQPTQLNLLQGDAQFKADVQEAIAKSRLISSKPSANLGDIQDKKARLEEIERLLRGYKALCDVQTGLYFGNGVDEGEYAQMMKQKDFRLAESFNAPNSYFHWELEFPEVCLSGRGFTWITCNPPYDTFKEDAFFKRSEVAGCGNLFGHFIAKAVSLNARDGSVGFIVPLSFSCGSSYEGTRAQIYDNYTTVFAGHYSIRPNSLFDGVSQRMTIFIAAGKGQTSACEVYSSRLWRWDRKDREQVVQAPGFVSVGQITAGLIPKVGSELGAQIYARIGSAPKKLGDLRCKAGPAPFVAYYHSVARYWITAYEFLPYFQQGAEGLGSLSSKVKIQRFANELDKDLFVLLMNSSLFYYWWIARGDEFDVLVSDIADFGLYGYDLFSKNSQTVSGLVEELMMDYRRNSVTRTTSLGGKVSHYQEFYPRLSRPIINRMDDFIAPIYGLTEDENEFLKDYDLRWRTDEGDQE
jgi:type I restriction-modification system DNA methylase subunit